MKSDPSQPAPWHLSEEERQQFDSRFSSFPFPTKFGSSPKNPFSSSASSPLKANDYCHLLSDLGVYALGDSALGFDQRRVLRRLFRVLNRLTRAALTIDVVKSLERELFEVLSEFELYFPFYGCTINLHLIVHLPSQILRCGPAPFHWMYGLERECGRLVDFVHSFKCAEESIARNYQVTELVEHRRAGNPGYLSPIHRHSSGIDDGDLSMLPMYLRHEAVCSVVGKRIDVNLSQLEQQELLSLWRRLDAPLNALFLRYEADIATRHVRMSISSWKPGDGGAPLTPIEESMRSAPCFNAQQFSRAFRNNAYFRSLSKDLKLKSCNSCFKANHPVLGLVYGIVDSFLLHRAYAHVDAPVTVFVKAAGWCKIGATDPENGLGLCTMFAEPPLDAQDAPFYTTFYCPFGDCLPMPVCLLTRSSSSAATVFYAIDLGR
jgi:hypothetical protein